MSFGYGGRYFFGVMVLEQDRSLLNPRKRRLGWPVAFVLVVLILALGGIFIFLRLESWPMRTERQTVAQLEQAGRKARDTFVRLAHLQPRVTINDRVYLEQKSDIAELAVLSSGVEVEHEMLHSWAGSTKRIRLHGTFLVKSGFDLRKRFSVSLRPEEIVIELPHAQILSVEQQRVDVLALENGFWNRISPNDIERELATLPELARKKSAGQPAEAEELFARDLRREFQAPQPIRIVVAPAGQSR